MNNATASFLAVLFGCTTTAAFAVIGVLGRALFKLSIDVRLMRQGATEGAQRLISALAARVELTEDALEQQDENWHKEHERISILANNLEGHIKTPASYAHPPQMA